MSDVAGRLTTSPCTLLEADDVTVTVRRPSSDVVGRLVHGQHDQTLGIVGESGSGKSMTSLADHGPAAARGGARRAASG